MPGDEKSLLLLSSGSEDDPAVNGNSAKYGTESEKAAGEYGEDATAELEAKMKHAWWKRERKLQRSPSLDKVDEDELEQERKDQSRKSSMGQKLFGVRSYLHNFYEGHTNKDPSVYEDDDAEYLLGGPRRRRCTSAWWKVFVWIGANLFLFGVIGILVGYLVPKKSIFIGKLTDHVYLEDREALAYNFHIDVCRLVGLILFCIGGLTLAVALLIPSFLDQYCEDDRKEVSFKVNVRDRPVRSPLEMQIPTSTLISGVQPVRKQKEAILTKEGVLPYSD